MNAVSAANYEEFLLKYELAAGRENRINSLCNRVKQNNIPVKTPQLERYDNLLRSEVI